MVKFIVGFILGMFIMYRVLSKYSINLSITYKNPKDSEVKEDETTDN